MISSYLLFPPPPRESLCSGAASCPCARMINGGTTMRSISWGRLKAERWSVFLYWTLHSHSKPWPGLQWFITGAVFWSLTFSTLPWLQKSGFHCQLKSRKRDPFKIQMWTPRKGWEAWWRFSKLSFK